MPQSIDTRANYLFYLHGRIIEDKGVRPTSARFGVYEYEKILETLRDRDFRVISEARPSGADAVTYADKVIGQVRGLLDAGVPASQITIIGASKGAFITLVVSSKLGIPEIGYIPMAICSPSTNQEISSPLSGRVLSIYDFKDTMAGTCQPLFERSSRLTAHEELVLRVGTGHGILYRPLAEWIDPAVRWARHEPLDPKPK